MSRGLDPSAEFARGMRRSKVALDLIRASQRVGSIALATSAVALIVPGTNGAIPASLAVYAATGVAGQSIRLGTQRALERSARRHSNGHRNRLALGMQCLALEMVSRRNRYSPTVHRMMLTALDYACRADIAPILASLTDGAAALTQLTPQRRDARVRAVAMKVAARALTHDDPLVRARWRLALWNATARIADPLAVDGDRTSQYHDACRAAIAALASEHQIVGASSADRAARDLHTVFPDSNVMALYAEVLHKVGDARAAYLTIFANDTDSQKIAAWLLLGGDRADVPASRIGSDRGYGHLR